MENIDSDKENSGRNWRGKGRKKQEGCDTVDTN